MLYQTDYDDLFPVARYNPEAPAGHDRTWVQNVLPYVRDFSVFQCPADQTRKEEPQAPSDPNVMYSDSYSRYYAASMRSNVGYNFLYFAPLFKQGGRWLSSPKPSSSLAHPTNTLMFAETAWEVENFKPKGGGNHLMIPPCRFIREEGLPQRDSFGHQSVPNRAFYTGNLLWDDQGNFGGLYAWYGSAFTSIMADGHAKTLTRDAVVSGCDVKGNWGGFVNDTTTYVWTGF